jgi:hypothetical protein
MTPRLIVAAVWVASAALLVLAVGTTIDWGAALRLPLPDLATAPSGKVAASVLPDFRLDTPLDKMPETTSRTLFNATRRPAPPPPPPPQPEPPKPQMKKGQFALLGTSIAGDRRTAMLRDVATGRVHRVEQGSVLRELTIAEVKPDKVVLTYAGDAEELPLRVASGRGPAQAAIAAQAPAARPGVPTPPQPGAAGLVQQGEQSAITPRARRVVESPQPPVAAPVPGAPVQESAATQAARDAAAAAEWRAIEERMREQVMRSQQQQR